MCAVCACDRGSVVSVSRVRVVRVCSWFLRVGFESYFNFARVYACALVSRVPVSPPGGLKYACLVFEEP